MSDSSFRSNLTRQMDPVVAMRFHQSGRKVPVTQVLMLEEYAGWYSALLHSGPGQALGHDRRVDVVVAPLGWLGTYRRSSLTGLWFRGRHETHELGNR